MSEQRLQEYNNKPRLKIFYEVEIGKHVLSFEKVSGLNHKQHRNYQANEANTVIGITSKRQTKIAMVTLKRGVFIDHTHLFDWINEIKTNPAKRQKVIIKMKDELGTLLMCWTLQNAWPSAVIGIDSPLENGLGAIESLELSYQDLLSANTSL